MADLIAAELDLDGSGMTSGAMWWSSWGTRTGC